MNNRVVGTGCWKMEENENESECKRHKTKFSSIAASLTLDVQRKQEGKETVI